MNGRTKLAIVALAAIVALVLIGTSSAIADPANTNSPPTEDWVFDEGRTTTITSKTWTIKYNMTVMNGSVLKLNDCIFTFDGVDMWNPIWIFGDWNSTIDIRNCEFKTADGAAGYYIETHDNITLSACLFEGLMENPAGDAGITVYGNQYVTALLEFVTVNNTLSSSGIYLENCQVDIDHLVMNNTGGHGVYIHGRNNEPNALYKVKMWDSQIDNTEGNALTVYGTNHYGIFDVEVINLVISNASQDGITVYMGAGTSDRGNGTVYAFFDQMEISECTRFGVFLSSIYQDAGNSNVSNVYNVTLVNSTIHDILESGVHVQLYQTVIEFDMIVENTEIYDIAMEASGGRLSGIWYWFYYSTGSTHLYVGNSTLRRCNPAGYEIWDWGSSDIEFYNTLFTRCKQTGVLQTVDSGGSQSPLRFYNCTFREIDGNGIEAAIQYLSQGSGSPYYLENTEMFNITDTAVNVNAQYYGKNVGVNMTNCDIHDIGSYAVDIYGYYVEGMLMCHVVNTTIDRTRGINVEMGQDSYNTGGSIDIRVFNSSITNTEGTAIKAKGSIYYNPNRLTLSVINSTISKAMGDGITASVADISTSTYYSPRWDSSVRVMNTTIEEVNGIGISLTATVRMKGTREYYIYNATIFGAQRGLFVIGFNGEMWESSVKGMLKEDVYCLDGVMNLYYNDFAEITDRKFKATEGGEIYFYYDLDIIVRWDTGAPAHGANVQIFDNKEILISVVNVISPDGSLDTYTLQPYFVRETGLFGSTPYVIKVIFLQVTKTIGVKLDRNRVIEIIMEDHYDPEIYILYPKAGHIQQSTTLQVRGAAWDSESGIKAVEVSLDGVNWSRAQGSLRWNYTLEVSDELIGRFNGLFLLRARATDYAHNEKTAFALIRIDPTPPELTVDFPYHGYTTNNPELWVRGVTELGSSVEINSVPVPVTVSMFTHKVMLVEGPNTISIISVDPLGNIQIVRMTVYLDTQPPYIILLHPDTDTAMTNEDTITIEATVEENLYITVNGYHVPYDSDWYPAGVGRLTYPVDLEHGENVVVIQARDEADNLVIQDFIVVYDTIPPWVQVINPKDGDILPKPEVTVIGTLDPTATLKIQGEGVTVRDGFFEIVILAFEGENTLTLTAEDEAGNVYEEEMTFWVDTQDPMLTVTAPKYDPDVPVVTKDPEFNITGTTAYEDDQGNVHVTATHIKVYGVYDAEVGRTIAIEMETDDEGNFEVPVTLLEGRNEFIIVAEDDVGNSATITRTVRLDTVAPTLVMYIDPIYVSDDEGMVSHALTVNITGYTDPGSYLTVNTIPLPVNEDGEFSTSYDLGTGETTIVLESTDFAENVRTVRQTVTYEPITDEAASETDWGFMLLLIALILLLVVIIATFFYVRGRREEMLEMDAAEATPLAPMEETVVEEPDTLPGPEEIEIEPEEEPAPTTAPVRPRPRPPQARRAAAPRPVPAGEKPEMEGKDLSEKDAEADIGADETDQEGI